VARHPAKVVTGRDSTLRVLSDREREAAGPPERTLRAEIGIGLEVGRSGGEHPVPAQRGPRQRGNAEGDARREDDRLSPHPWLALFTHSLTPAGAVEQTRRTITMKGPCLVRRAHGRSFFSPSGGGHGARTILATKV
jgi:hypothetical protein